MIYIEMGNVVSKFYNLPDSVEEEIRKELSYATGGFGAPTETRHLYNDVTHMTYTGLVPRVLGIITKYGLQYQLNDKRIKHISNGNFAITDEFPARDYQANIIDRASSREIIQCATGGGKTYIMASLIAKFNVFPVMVVAPKVSLANQLRDEINKFLKVKVGLVGGGHNINPGTDIIIGTPQTLVKNEEIVKSAKAIFFDECHNIPANTIFEIASKAVNAYYRIGVSATPWRDGEEDILIEAALNIRKPNLSITASDLIEKGKLTPCKINFIPIKANIGWQGTYNQTYEKVIVSNEGRNNLVADIAVKKFKNGNSTIVLISRNLHGKKLLAQLKSKVDYQERLHYDPKTNTWHMVGNVEFISGEDDQVRREAVFHAVKDGFCKTLIASTIADEGLDLPVLDTLILAGAGKSSTRAFQRVGRILRLYEGKKLAEVYDFIDDNPTFYNQAMTRKALYETERLWDINTLEEVKCDI